MIHVYWYDEEQTIIRLDYEAPVTSWEEYQQAVDHSCQMAQQVSHPVCMIHNPDRTSMPPGNPLDQLKRAIKKTPPNVKTVAMVVNNRLARRFVKSALYILRVPTRYKIVQSVEEAEALLSGADSFS